MRFLPNLCWRWLVLSLALSPVALAWTGPEEVCPRQAAGSVVPEPTDLRSHNGVLKVDFEYHSSVDAGGITRFCFLTAGGVQAPNLRLRPGDELVLTLRNRLNTAEAASRPLHNHSAGASTPCTTGPVTSASTNLHFHGLLIAPVCHQDDTLNTAIQPDDAPFEYRFTIPKNQPPGVYWYHPHIHGFTRAQVLGGASGALIVEGIEDMNGAVRGLVERVLVFRDQELANPDATPIWKGPGPAPPPVVRDADGDVRNTGTGGGTPAKDLSINYVPVPFPDYPPAVIKMRPGEKQLWRVLNASAITYIDLRLLLGDAPQSLGIVALDGVPLNYENPKKQTIDTVNHVLIPPAGRAEFIVTGPRIGASMQLVTRSVDTGPVGDNDPIRPLATVVASASAPEPHSRLTGHGLTPAVMRTTPLRDVKPVRQRLIYFSEKVKDPTDPNSPTVFFVTVDGQTPKPFDPSSPLPDITVQSGDVEDWTIENRSKELHAFHIHQTHFLLLEQNGFKVDEPFLRDTVNIEYWREKMQEFPSVKLRMDFRNPNIVGTFAYHCHLLEHQDGGMMGTIRVEPRPAAGINHSGPVSKLSHSRRTGFTQN